MNYNKYYKIVHLLLFSFCLCEISVGQKEKLLNGFVNYYNNLPNQIYTCNEGSLQNTQQVDETTYQIVADIKVTEISNIDVTKSLKCTATIQDSDNGVTVTSNHCQEQGQQSPGTGSQEQVTEALVEVTEPTVERKPVQLVNEVQSGTAIASGEQFIAIPRDQPSAPCIGCASHVNPQAVGVSDLANLGIKHLDIHEPSVKHSLDSVLDVKRQVQVVNGVRYILTLSILYNNCSEINSEDCASSKTCKITILEKPRLKLSNGANYRAILANNCTEEWQYGDNGEVLPNVPPDNHMQNQLKGNTFVDDVNDGDIRAKYNTELQSQPNKERSLTNEEIKNIQDQILPNNRFPEITETNRESVTISLDMPNVSKQHVFEVESAKNSENSIPTTESGTLEQQTLNINPDKKKAIDDMLDFFDFSGFKPRAEVEEAIPRTRRSYDYDLQVLSLAEDFHGIKKSIKNAQFMYELAQAMVDYLNEMDMEVKNRAVKNVIRAEEEIESLRRFVYVQASVTIPCDNAECKPIDGVTQICNGVIDSTNENNPQILNTFCYNDNKERNYREAINEIYPDDPILQKLATEALKKIESKSKSQYAMKINKVVSANTQKTTGTLTKFSIIIDNIKCNKSVPLALRINCTVLEQLGTKICEVIIHEIHWLKEKKISYTCTDRPVDVRMSKAKPIAMNETVNDPIIVEMLQEAIQYLETQSNKNIKQKIVSIKSISSQIIAGFLTKIEFVVGFTNCTDGNYAVDDLNKCELLNSEELRLCRAQIWDRSWIMDGRQVEVTCDDVDKSNEIEKTRKKRSIDFIGGQMPQSVNDNNNHLEFIKLANESLKKYLQSSSSRQHYEIVKVDRVSVQDVPGKLTRIEFSISPTNCVIQSDGHPSLSKCDIVNSKSIFRCRSKILEKVWLDKKQYFVNCNIKDQKLLKDTRLDGLKKHNPRDAKYYQLAEESMRKYLNDTGHSPHHRIIRVVKVTTQIVSGLLTSIDFEMIKNNKSDSDSINCHSEILEKHWLGTKDFNVTCQTQDEEKTNTLQELNPYNPIYMQIAVESLQKYMRNTPDSHLVRVTLVDKVTRTGELTKISFMASHKEDDDGDTLCQAEFSEQGLPGSEIQVRCHLIGTVIKTEITKDLKYLKYLHLADDSLNYYLQSINSSQEYTVINIENVTIKWDDGITTLIDFIISPMDLDTTELYVQRCNSQIRKQPWLHKKHIEVKCKVDKDLYRTKRQVSNVRIERQLGGLKEGDATKPQYRVLAEESLRQYVHNTGVEQPLEVIVVEKVFTQVVSGSMTYIDFTVSGSQDSNTIKCHSEVWEQAWLNKKEIKVSCQESNQRVKRDQLVGGKTEQDPTKPQYRVLAEESLRQHVHDTGVERPLEVIVVEKVFTQVVSGSMTYIDFTVSGSQDSNTIKCHSEVWEQAWLNKKEIKVSCQESNQRVKRDQHRGGKKEQNPTEPQYRVLAEESLRQYVHDTGVEQPLEVIVVEKVFTQVVSGSMTYINFTVSGSQDSNTIKCHSEVWEQAWLNKKEIKVSCQESNQRVKRDQLVGGKTERDPTEPQYRVLAEESLRQHVHDTGVEQPLEVIVVEKVFTQVVSGSMTYIDFTVSGSQDSNTIKCHSEVWEQAWLNKKEIKVSCQESNQRVKRDILIGGKKEQDPTKPQYRVLAEESLRQHVHDTGVEQPLEEIVVEKVFTQVVSGSVTYIDFTVSGSQDSNKIKCHSEVWEQAWLNKKEIKVSCQESNQRVKRDQHLGGKKEQNPTEPQYRVLAEESLRQYVLDTGVEQPLEVIVVEKVFTQVVSGSITNIDFTVSGSQDSNTIKCHSEVWEQAWLNKKEIKVSCQESNQRVKRDQHRGGKKEQNPTEPQYRVLAEESLRQYVHNTGVEQPLEVIVVEKVFTQVVSGSMTYIDFTVSGSQDSNTIKCHSEVWEQAWLNKKEIKVSCQESNQRVKRDQHLGGKKEQNPTEPQYRVLAEESLRQYVLDTGVEQPLEVIVVEKVFTQVVSGSITDIDFTVSGSQDSNTIKCHSEVWEQAWLNKKEIKVSCQESNQRVKRDILIGGKKEQDPTKPQYRVLAEESLRQHVHDTGVEQPLEVIVVEKVFTQVVSGSMTYIDFTVSGSQDSNTIKCHSEVWEQAWLNKKEIKVSCQESNQRVKRDQHLGGKKEQNPTEPQYRVLAEESLRQYVLDTGVEQPLEVIVVEKVFTQVVSGSMTYIDFTVSGSQVSNTIKCHSEVWEQAWLNKKEIKVSCQESNQRVKRDQLIGGKKEQDPTKPQYRVLAEESLRQHVHDTGVEQPLEVIVVEKVFTQVVSGSMTYIDFTVSGSQDSNTIKCHSEVWEQAWLNKKEIKVSCQESNQRVKRDQHRGGKKEQNPTERQYRVLAEESLRQYVHDTGVEQPLEVIVVEKVFTQVVSGSMTYIDFTVSGSQDSNTIKCHSEVWEQAWLNKKEIKVSCQESNQRVKRQTYGRVRVIKDQLHTGSLRGHSEDEQDPNKPEYKRMAEESLRKYEKKSTIHHKVVEVKRVRTRVVSGLKYKIEFSAAPTVCPVNVTNVHARSCKAMDDVILFCHTEIWDRPWLKQKKINIQCYGPDDDDLEEYESDFDPANNNDEKYKTLAEEASEKYLTTSKRKYVHKVTGIHSASELIADGTVTKIEFSLSPTTCLRNETRGSNDTCGIKQPLIVFHCNTTVWDRPSLHLEKDIKVICKKNSTNKTDKKHKRELGIRPKRQIGEDDDEIDEDTTYYYADRAVQHVNDQSSSNNLHKLISIHAAQNSVQMGTTTVRMYIEIAETFCLRHHREVNLYDCEEMNGLNHRLCLARLWPSPDDELVVRHVSVVCDDEQDFQSVTGVNIPELLKMSIEDLERSPDNTFKLVHQGEPQVIPSLDSKIPFKINFIVATTNCSKKVNLDKNPFQCFINTAISSKACHSFIWLKAETRFIRYIKAECTPRPRSKRSLLDPANVTLDNLEIQKLVTASLEKLEMSSLHRYKQRVLQINSHSTKITSGKVTTIDFDVGYTSCLKYEWVENITSCDFLEHLPRRRCVAQIWERLWIKNGNNIDVNCVDDETPLESHIEFESAEMANELAREALKHIEAKYPHPSKQKVVRIFSLEKQVVAGIHYRMKVEVGFTDCVALSEQTDCQLLKNMGVNKFCRVNVWVRPWTEHPPNFRVSCDFQEGTTRDLYHHVQAEHLFYNFLTTYSPSYVNDYSQMQKRFEIFKTNIKKIHEFNVHEKGTARYGVTRFTDLTYEEFSSGYMGLKTNLRDANQLPIKKADIPDIKVPLNFDWREYDAVTEVKDQGSCGSCWAFSVTGNIEGQWKMQSGQLVSLSEQELVDCDKLDDGCNGGLPDNAYRSIEQLGGLELESDYPYEGVDEKCEFNKTMARVQISGAVNITSNETGMSQWLVHNGPISIGINANAMQFYMGGISHPWKMLCNPTNLDHGVLIVGYGIKDYPLFHKQLPYWIIKNSWGKSWGEQGYYRVYRGDGTCGVNQMASSAVI